ncbi:MAG: hypothetical protein KDD50_04040 [Bdellovibrionales bacterium]|nr:hypothetical protein [Bdellovibrionales bacterium]
MKKTVFIILIVGLLASNAFLPKDHGHGFPVYTLTYQLINLAIVVIVLYSLLKTKIAQFYLTKHDEFHEFLNRAEKTKQELEAHHQDLTDKINTLEQTKNETIQKAHSEAEELKRRTLEEAKNLSEKLAHDAQITAKIEVEKAKEDLREYLLESSLQEARESLEKKISPDDLARLQTEFVSKIEAVHQ